MAEAGEAIVGNRPVAGMTISVHFLPQRHYHLSKLAQLFNVTLANMRFVAQHRNPIMRLITKQLLLPVVLAACIVGCRTNPVVASGDPAAQLRQQADAWDRAIVQKNVAAISENMAESFQQIDSQGNLSDKSGFLSGITSDKLAIFPYEPEDVVIRFYGDVALISGTTSLHGTYDGKPFKTHYRYTDTYVKESGTWRVVNVQTTEMAD